MWEQTVQNLQSGFYNITEFLFIYLFIYLFVCLFIYLFIHSFIFLFFPVWLQFLSYILKICIVAVI